MTKSEARNPPVCAPRTGRLSAWLDRARDWDQDQTAAGSNDSSFGFWASFVIRHSSFGLNSYALGHDRLEAACRRALHFGTCSYTSLKSILQNNLDAQPLEPELPVASPVHENLRGSPYYDSLW